MAAYIGKDGDIWVNTTSSTSASTALGMMDTWTLTPSIETADVTAYGSSFRDRAQTLKDWTAEMSGTLDRSDTQQDAILDMCSSGALGNIALRFYTHAASYWSGNGLLTGASVVSSIGDKVTMSYSFIANGALSFTSS